MTRRCTLYGISIWHLLAEDQFLLLFKLIMEQADAQQGIVMMKLLAAKESFDFTIRSGQSGVFKENALITS